MKKNFKIAIAAGAIGGLLLITTAFANMSSGAGYEAYKTALKNVKDIKSVTQELKVTLKDNDKTIVDMSSAMKLGVENELMSSTMTINSGKGEQTVAMYHQDSKMIIKKGDSEIYNVYEQGKGDIKNHERYRKHQGEEISPENIKDIEKVIDALAGNIKNYTTLNTKADGSKDIALELSKDQISPVANALTSLAFRNMDMKKHDMKENCQMDIDINSELPKLRDDIRIESINMNASIDKDDMIKNQTALITVSGKDSDGKVHELQLNLYMNFTDINKTAAEKIDLTGKQVKIIENKDMDRE